MHAGQRRASSSSWSGAADADHRRRRHRRRRHRGDPLHVGHDRHAQGRRAHARQPDAQRRERRASCSASDADAIALGRAAAVSLLRPDLRDERDARRRRHADADARASIPAKALEIIQRDQVNVFQGVPTMYGAMLHHPERERVRRLARCELCASGGSAMPVELMRGFEEAFGCKILEGYGLSETSPVASFNHPDRERKPGLDRHPDRRRRDEGRRRRRQRRGAGRGRRDRDPRPQRDEGLLEARRRDRGDDPRRLAAHRRHGQDRRGRLLLHRRPQEGH